MEAPSPLTVAVWAVVAVLAMAACAKTSTAATHTRAPFAGPTAPCDFVNRMEIQVIDGVWFECVCSVLANSFDCAWHELPEPAVANARKRIKPKLHHRVVVRYALPGVVS